MKGAKLSSCGNFEYAKSLILAMITQNATIWMNDGQISSLNPDLKELFISDTGEFGSFVDFLRSEHMVTVCPILMSEWIINQNTLDLIRRTEEAHHGNIRITGPIIEWQLSDDEIIVFQPQLVKISDAFHVKMVLLETRGNLPVLVHFNLECPEANNYFISLHPRMMNVKWGNTFNIPLPVVNDEPFDSEKTRTLCPCVHRPEAGIVENSMSIKISTMIHRADIFSDEKSNSNKQIMANMSSASHSYAFPDALSYFYGISNSIISVIDSISDILFIVFLSQFAQNQIGEPKQKVNFMMALAIGNMISVAVAISMYIASKIRNNPNNAYSNVQLFALCCVFFILSPFIAGFEWIMKKVQDHSSNILVISPNHDGILLWLQQELVRNDIFLIESMFESNFQIIIQFMCLFILQQLDYTNIYLYASIIISLLVILSKFVLLSYNLNRSMFLLNLFSYFLDIIWALIFSIFIGAFVFEKNFRSLDAT